MSCGERAMSRRPHGRGHKIQADPLCLTCGGPKPATRRCSQPRDRSPTRSPRSATGYETPVIAYLLRRTGNVDLSVDLASETFAAALASAHRYKPTSATAAPWLFTIAQNTLAESARRGRVEARARWRIGIRDAIEYTADELERVEYLAGQSDWATQLLQALPADQREAIRARIIDERSYEEIARHMQTSELVVRKRVSRGLATLRPHLEEPT
jgi:RNA polymerase sigma factor (sigma-70 family)